MPREGLRSNLNLQNYSFPDTDDLRRRRRNMANVANNQQVPPVNQNQNPAPVAQPPPEVWSENPNQGNFNPGTKEGAAIYKLKTKSDTENRLELK